MKKLVSTLLAFAIVLGVIFTNRSIAIENNQKTISEKIKNMTIREKIGQIIMPDFRKWKSEGDDAEKNVTALNSEIKEIIKKYKFGGIILFAENVVDTEQTVRLTSEYQKLALENNLPPFLLSIDQEGGKVVRLGTGTSLPGNMALGATRDLKLAYEYGKIIAEELDSLGINVDLAPVLDVNNNPNNPVIGERSISSNPELVGEIGSQLVKGLQENKVSAAVKHFPGHGDTEVDSHIGLPEVNKSKSEVMDMELLPFKKVVKEGVDMIMTAHISYPQLEKDKAISKKDGKEISIPATLSDDILTGIIRKEMKYDGLIITDALNMQAIADHFGQAEASLRSFKAGADILLMPVIMRSNEDVEKLEKVYSILEKAVQDGEISEERLDNSVRRVLELKEKRGVSDVSKYAKSVDEKVKNALSVVGSKKHLEKQRLITQKSITVGKNENMLPFRPKNEEKVLMLAAYKNEIPGLNYGFDRLQREGIISNDVEYSTVSYNKETTKEQLAEQMKGYNYIVVISEISKQSQLSKDSWQSNVPQMVVDIANDNNQKHVVLSVAKPYDLDRYKNAKAVVLAYGAKGMDPTEKGSDPVKTFGPNIPTSLDVIFGKVASSGKLPVDVPEITEDYKYGKIKYPFDYGLITSLKDIEDKEETDSEETTKNTEKETEKETKKETKKETEKETEKESKNETEKEKEKPSDNVQNPETGDGGILVFIGIAIVSILGFVTLILVKRKK